MDCIELKGIFVGFLISWNCQNLPSKLEPMSFFIFGPLRFKTKRGAEVTVFGAAFVAVPLSFWFWSSLFGPRVADQKFAENSTKSEQPKLR